MNTTCLSVCVLGNEPFPIASVSSPHPLSLFPSLSLVAHRYSGLQVKGVATHLQFSALIANYIKESKGKRKEKAIASEILVWLASLRVFLLFSNCLKGMRKIIHKALAVACYKHSSRGLYKTDTSVFPFISQSFHHKRLNNDIKLCSLTFTN